METPYIFDAAEQSRLVKAGLRRARRRGVMLGRAKALHYPTRDLIRRSIREGRLTVASASARFNVGETTIRRYLKEELQHGAHTGTVVDGAGESTTTTVSRHHRHS